MRWPGGVSLVLVGVFCVLSLSACDFFTASVFPDYLPRLEGSLDLQAYLADDDEGGGSRLEVFPDLAAGGKSDLLFLTIWRPGVEPRLLILDQDLDIVGDWDQLTASSALGGGSFGRTALIDAGYRYVIGSIAFDPATLQPVLYTGAPDNLAGVTKFDASPANNRTYLLWVDGDSPQLNVAGWNAAWGATTSYAAALTSMSLSMYAERAAWDSTNGHCYVAFGTYGNVIILRLPATEFEAGSLVPPLVDNYPPFVIPNAQAESVQFTQGGVVVRTHDGERQLWGEGGLLETYDPAEDEGDIFEAYSPLGERYYALDRKQKVLRKLAVWW